MATEPAFEPGGWVVRRDWRQIAQIKNVHPAMAGWGPTLDLVIFARDGTRVGRESPAMGGPRGFEPCCDVENWAPISKPAFPIERYTPLFRAVRFANPADEPEDDGRL